MKMTDDQLKAAARNAVVAMTGEERKAWDEATLMMSRVGYLPARLFGVNRCRKFIELGLMRPVAGSGGLRLEFTDAGDLWEYFESEPVGNVDGKSWDTAYARDMERLQAERKASSAMSGRERVRAMWDARFDAEEAEYEAAQEAKRKAGWIAEFRRICATLGRKPTEADCESGFALRCEPESAVFSMKS